MDIAKLVTYPDMFSDYEQYLENEDYDFTIRVFKVPLQWAVDWVFNQFKMAWEDFLNDYTWDDTYQMYEAAKADEVLLDEQIVSRRIEAVLEAQKIEINGKAWYWQEFDGQDGNLVVVNLYDGNGDFVAEFPSYNGMMEYIRKQ